MKRLEPVRVGLLGLGTVGGGTVNVLRRNQSEIARRAGRGIVITHAAARETNFPGVDSAGIEISADAFAVVERHIGVVSISDAKVLRAERF